ncbi:MAG: glucose-6-phosphate isomerase [Thermodesulfobacteriota bacterium]
MEQNRKISNEIFASLGNYASHISTSLDSLSNQNFIERLWAKDPTLWKQEPEHRKIITNALGWLNVTKTVQEQINSVVSFSDEIRESGFKQIVLLGMGGSSLAPEVLRSTFGLIPGYPELIVLDSTDPDAVTTIENRINISQTLFLFCSKSGSTIEPLSLFRYFYSKVRAYKNDLAGENFVSITDPGTELEKLSKDQNFRRIFLNPSDIGGRFSALSYFGIVPTALIGIDISKFLDRAQSMADDCVCTAPPEKNPGLYLGSILGTLSKKGRTKATFILSPEIEVFSLWLEQLIAESTGKEGKGIVPIAGEPLDDADKYGNDRAFFYLRLQSTPEDSLKPLDQGIEALVNAGHPVIRIDLSDTYDLAREFFRWEVATAVAGAVIGVNPFDQPDVESAKVRTRVLLSDVVSKGSLPPLQAKFVKEHFSLTFGVKTWKKSLSGCKNEDSTTALNNFFKLLKKDEYLGILSYFDPNNAWLKKTFISLREKLRKRLGATIQFGFGPRYLHSTGQLHKGGANNGLFLIITHVLENDVAIPGEEYTFGQLEISQALGDLQALDSNGRRVALIQLKSPLDKAFTELQNVIEEATKI